MISTITAAHSASGVLWLLLLIVGVLCLLGAAWRAWERDFLAAVALLVVGIVLVFLST